MKRGEEGERDGRAPWLMGARRLGDILQTGVRVLGSGCPAGPGLWASRACAALREVGEARVVRVGGQNSPQEDQGRD